MLTCMCVVAVTHMDFSCIAQLYIGSFLLIENTYVKVIRKFPRAEASAAAAFRANSVENSTSLLIESAESYILVLHKVCLPVCPKRPKYGIWGPSKFNTPGNTTQLSVDLEGWAINCSCCVAVGNWPQKTSSGFDQMINTWTLCEHCTVLWSPWRVLFLSSSSQRPLLYIYILSQCLTIRYSLPLSLGYMFALV